MILDFRQIGLLLNSISLAAGAAFTAILLGATAAFFIERFEFPGKKFARLLLLVPILIPPYIHALSWRFLLVNLKIPSYQDFLFTVPAAILILSFAFYPIAFFLISNALKNLDASLEEASLLFSSRLKTTFKITLPLLAPAVFSAFLFIFLLGLTEFGVPSFLHINTFVFEIFAQFSAFFNYGRAFTLSLPLLLITLAVVFAWFLLIKDKPFVILSSSSRPLLPIQVSLPVKISSLAFLIILITLSVFLPLFSLFWQAGSFKSFGFALKTSWLIILKTLWLSGLAATLLTALIFLISAYFWLKPALSKSPRFRSAVKMVCLSLLAIPSVSLGIILVKIFNRPFLETIYTSFWIIVVGFLIRFFPYSAEILNVFWAQIDAKLLEVAKLTGAPFWQVLRRILIPLLLPGLLVAWITTFILSLGELGITLLVYPSGYQTLPIRIFTLLHYGAPELVAALSIMLITIILVLVSIDSIIIKKVSTYD